jgi:hypothetical protein
MGEKKELIACNTGFHGCEEIYDCAIVVAKINPFLIGNYTC